MGLVDLPLDALQSFMECGDFNAALNSFAQASQTQILHKDFPHWCQTAAEELEQQYPQKEAPEQLWHPARVAPAAVMAELLFYIGRGEEAGHFVKPYVQAYTEEPDMFWQRVVEGWTPSQQDDPTLWPALRLALQVAQWHYRHRDFGGAGQMSMQLRDVCHKELPSGPHPLGTAVGWHQLARAWSRQDDFVKAEDACDQAMRWLALAGEETATWTASARALAWRMGVVWLAEGHIAFVRGDFSTAERKFQQARFFLRKTGDFIHYANVQSNLGCIASTRGQYPQADDHFAKAVSGYKTPMVEHRLFLARVYEDWGRNTYAWGYLDDQQLANAEKQLEQSKHYAQSIDNKRQLGLADIELSLLYGEEQFSKRSRDKAEQCLDRGKRLLFGLTASRRSRLRALWAWGIYLMRTAQYDRATEILKQAKVLADDLKIAHLQAETEMLLCRAYCHEKSGSQLGAARQHYRNAIAILTEVGRQEDNLPFLLKKSLDQLQHTLLGRDLEQIVIPKADIANGQKGIHTIEREVRKQLFAQALECTAGHKGQAAILLKLSRPAFDKAWKQLHSEDGRYEPAD